MKVQNLRPQTDKEREIRRHVHAKAILLGISMREAVFAAMELWLRESKKRRGIGLKAEREKKEE